MQLHLPKGWTREFRRYIMGLTDGGKLSVINALAMKGAADKAADLIRKGYDASAFPHREGTQQAYRYGKKRDLKPSKRKYPNALSLRRSMTLRRSIVVRVRRQGRTKMGGYNVQIHPDKVYGGLGDKADKRGLKVETIGYEMENPRPQVIRMTQAMAAYLASMRDRDGEPRGATKVPVGSTFVIRRSSRKVWAPVFKRIRTVLPTYNKIFNKYMSLKDLSWVIRPRK